MRAPAGGLGMPCSGRAPGSHLIGTGRSRAVDGKTMVEDVAGEGAYPPRRCDVPVFPGGVLVALWCDRPRRVMHCRERCRPWVVAAGILAPAEAAGSLGTIKLSDRKTPPWPGSS